MDPEGPAPGVGDGGMLADVDPQLIDALVDSTVGTPLLSVEIRHLGGAVSRPRGHHGAVSAFEAPFIFFAIGIAPGPEAHDAVEEAVGFLSDAIAPWGADHTYMNFAETRRSAGSLFTPEAHERLLRIKSEVDPQDVIRSNHPL
jgi:hypothetical protein